MERLGIRIGSGVAAAMVLWPGLVLGQSLRAADLPSASVAYSTGVLGSSDFDTIEGRSVRLHWDRLVARFADHRKDRWLWGVGFEWEFTRPDYGGVVSRNRDLHRLQVPLMLQWEDEDLAVSVEISPGLSTSSNVLSHLGRDSRRDDFMVSGRVEFTGPAGEDRRWLLGLVADRRLGGSRVYPTVGWLAEAGPWRVDARLPDPMLRRRFDGGQALVARIYPAGHQWHVLSKLTDSTSRYFLERWHAELGWQIQVLPRIGVEISAGYAFARRHEFDDDLELRQRSDVAPGAYLAASIQAHWGSE